MHRHYTMGLEGNPKAPCKHTTQLYGSTPQRCDIFKETGFCMVINYTLLTETNC